MKKQITKNKKIKKKPVKKQAKRKVREERVGKDLTEMDQVEKKTFLSMDLIERMVRIEQRVSASFNNDISYDQTEYYMSLSSAEKAKFEKYLAKNKRKKFLLAGFLVIPLFLLFFLRTEITGNAIKQTIGNQTAIGFLEPCLAGILLATCALFLITLVFKKRKLKRHERNFEILEDVFLKKGMIKHY